MASYLGVKCPICDKKFDQSDDIVVCPACGAPHHRECYAQRKECAFVADHLSGSVWRPPQEPCQDSEKQNKNCSRCGAQLPGDALFCSICGHYVSAAQRPETGTANRTTPQWAIPGMDFIGDPLYSVYGGVNPDEHIEDESVRDLAAYIGPSSAYYIPRFRDMAEHGRTVSPNFAALIFSFFFYFYRKMHLLGLVSLALFAASSIPGYLYMREAAPLLLNEMAQMGFSDLIEMSGIVVPSYEAVDLTLVSHYYGLSRIASLINFTIGAVLSICANRMYYEKCLKAVREVRMSASEGGNGQSYRAELMRLGGISKGAPAIACAVVVVVYFVSNATLFTWV